MTDSGEFRVRQAEIADFETWFTLFDAVASEGKWIGAEQPLDRDARRDAFERSVASDDEVTLLAETPSLLVGTIGVEARRGLADIGMMVDSTWRGRGVGTVLMRECISWAAEHRCHKITLQLWPHNTTALALYNKFGFVEEARLHRHYRRRNGQLWDAIALGLVLDWDAPGSPYEL
jgi:RimJ/RimL family protein N-acetyltransferase